MKSYPPVNKVARTPQGRTAQAIIVVRTNTPGTGRGIEAPRPRSSLTGLDPMAPKVVR